MCALAAALGLAAALVPGPAPRAAASSEREARSSGFFSVGLFDPDGARWYLLGGLGLGFVLAGSIL